MKLADSIRYKYTVGILIKGDWGYDYGNLLSSTQAFITMKIFATNLRSMALALSLLALSLAEPAQALEVAPFIGQSFGGGFVDANTGDSFAVADSNAYGLILDFDTEPDKQIEILLSRQNSYLSTNDPLFTPNPLFDLTIDYYQLGGLYMIPTDEL